MAFYAHWSETARGYAVAIVASAMAVVVRLLTLWLIGDRAPFVPFVLAVLVSAWYGGLKPGLLATVLGVVLGDFFFVEPFRSTGSVSFGGPSIIAAFTVICVATTLACEALHTARRRLEEQQEVVLRAEERIRSVVDHVVDGIITMDERGVVESFNRAAERMFGYSASEIIGTSVLRLLPKSPSSSPEEFLTIFSALAQSQTGEINREGVGLRRDGTTFPMDLAVSEFHVDRQRFFTGIIRDVTERKRIEEDLKEADRRKYEFLVSLSHELRNPLAPLYNGIQLMQYMQNDPEQMTEIREIMERQVRVMVRMVDDLLDVNRISTGKLTLRLERVNLNDVIQTAVESVKPLIESHNHELVVSLPSDPIELEGDSTRLIQIFSNLLNNAAKYSELDRKIWLSVKLADESVVVSVKDNGIGIAEKDLHYIFQTFTQVTSAVGHSRGGLGIGLSLVHGFVELHGGTVEAHSEGEGHGSEFTVRLPLRQTADPKPSRLATGGPHITVESKGPVSLQRDSAYRV